MLAYFVTVDLVNLGNRFNHFINGVYEVTFLLIYNDFWCSAACKRDHRAAQRHRFDHDHAKGFFPFDGVEETASAAEQVDLLPHIYWPDICNLFSPDQWFNHP